MSVTADHVRRAFLDPAMDARALNQDQARLIYDPSPEVDSLLEVLGQVSPATDECRRHMKRAIAKCVKLGLSNRGEGGLEARVAGAADQLTRELHGQQLQGNSAIAAKACARMLREPLSAIACPPLGEPRRLIEAGRAVGEVFVRVPSEVLLSRAVEHELGVEKFALLSALYERREVVPA